MVIPSGKYCRAAHAAAASSTISLATPLVVDDDSLVPFPRPHEVVAGREESVLEQAWSS